MAQTSAHNKLLGTFGEDAAASWYEANGYCVVDRNWRCRDGELDLVATVDSTVAFIEVKTRTSRRFGTAAEAVDYRKQRRIRALALHWLSQHEQYFEELRFDVIEVDAKGSIKPHLGCF